jgi:hypothetical protein
LAALELSAKTRILHAALHLTSFTVKQLAELVEEKENTVQTVLGRFSDLVEEVGSLPSERPGGRSKIYRLRDRAREKLAREAVALAATLNAPSISGTADTVRRAETVLTAAESAAEAGKRDASWRERARSQANLARKLVNRVVDSPHRDRLDMRMDQLEADLADRPTSRATTSVLPRNWLPQWQALAQQLRAPDDSFLVYFTAHGMADPAPALVLRAMGDADLPERLTTALHDAQHLVLDLQLGDVLAGLQERPAREVLLNALQTSPHANVYVTLDSQRADSRGMVESLMTVFEDHFHDYMWKKNQEPPLVPLDVTLIDASLSATLIGKGHTFRNVSYLCNIQGASTIEGVIQGVVDKPLKDSVRSG